MPPRYGEPLVFSVIIAKERIGVSGEPRSTRKVDIRIGKPMDPLHADPSRPQVDADGSLRNPIGGPTVVPLHEDVPVRPDQLVASTTYSSPGFEYLTDEQALPARVRGVLRIVPRELRVRHKVVQRMVGNQSGGTHGGHIVAVSLGGFASGPNVFPQIGNFNVSAYARLERGWRAALRAGATVEVDIALAVDVDDPFAPSFVVVTYWEDGEDYELPLLNEAGAQ
jgi:DNA/RNA non-specific endonuclease